MAEISQEKYIFVNIADQYNMVNTDADQYKMVNIKLDLRDSIQNAGVNSILSKPDCFAVTAELLMIL